MTYHWGGKSVYGGDDTEPCHGQTFYLGNLNNYENCIAIRACISCKDLL